MAENLRVEIELDPQPAYDNARVMVAAWTAFARTLREAAVVCDHPERCREDGNACSQCGHVVPEGL